MTERGAIDAFVGQYRVPRAGPESPHARVYAAASAARAYVAARAELAGTTGPDLTRCIGLVDMAWHELLVALDEPCECDPGTCPRHQPTSSSSGSES